MNIKSLCEVTDDMEIDYIEQDYEFKIGEEGYLFEASLERDCEGNITDVTPYGVLTEPKTDVETYIASIISKDAYIWYDLDQKVYDVDVNDIFIHYVDVDEFLKNNMFEEEEIEFIREHEDNGYMKVYITVTSNTVVEGEE